MPVDPVGPPTGSTSRVPGWAIVGGLLVTGAAFVFRDAVITAVRDAVYEGAIRSSSGWADGLSPKEKTAFRRQLRYAIDHNDAAAIPNLLSDWHATAEAYADPEVVEEFRRPITHPGAVVVHPTRPTRGGTGRVRFVRARRPAQVAH